MAIALRASIDPTAPQRARIINNAQTKIVVTGWLILPKWAKYIVSCRRMRLGGIYCVTVGPTTGMLLTVVGEFQRLQDLINEKW